MKSLKSLLMALTWGAAAVPAFAQVTVQPSFIDFGLHGQNEKAEAVITIRNTGPRPLAVKKIEKSCDCLSLSPAAIPMPLPPGGTATVKVTMGSGRAMGRLDKWLTVVAGDRLPQEVRVPIVMRVLDSFELEPREVVLEGVVGGKPVTTSVEVRLRKGQRQVPVSLEVRGIQSRFGRTSGKFLHATAAPISGGQRLTITLDPEHPEGAISAELEAVLDGKALFIPIRGEMFAWIKVSPNYVNFSRASEDAPDSLVREVILESTDGTPFRIVELAANPSGDGGKLAKLHLDVVSAGTPGNAPVAAPGRPPSGSGAGPGSPPAPSGGGSPEASGAVAASAQASTVQKVVCLIERGEGAGQAFFGTITIRTDHPKKPVVEVKYSGFFLPKK